MTFRKSLTFVCLSLASAALYAQSARPSRLRSSISRDATVALTRHVHVNARPQFDQGAVDPAMLLKGLTLNFKPSPTQQAALEGLLAGQQNPNSPHFHQWLAPEDFGNRFGLTQGDYDQVYAWLAAQGFTLSPATRTRRWITFQGTAGQVEKAFGTSIHHYLVNGELHYANATNPSIPAALSGMVLNLHGLHDFKLKARAKLSSRKPDYNFADGTHALAPDDFATIYNVTPLYTAGMDGTGQTIVVAGQSNIRASDVTRFRSRFNLSARPVQTMLAPGETDPGEVPGDINESSLDVQWAGAVARNATILFVYANDVQTAIEYAVDQNLAPVMSVSYGICEQFDLVDLPANQALAQQANAEGITWLNASGDAGATDCEDSGVAIAQTGLAVDAPSSIPEITGMGGTGFQDANSALYWAASANANSASALSYIPETAWNDTGVSGTLASGGGGNSVLFPKPAWQTGNGVTSGSFRQVPDLALNSSGESAPYISYTQGSVGYYYGTSAATPTMAGIIALLNQYLVSKGAQKQPGLGNINPALYRLAQNNPAVFHDVTGGSNAQPCASGSPDCANGSEGFASGSGYDRATGLGSVDANAFVTAWANSPPTGSIVVPSIDQIPVFQGPSISLSPTPNTTNNWIFTLTLNEEAGIGTTLTGFSINGNAAALNLFNTTAIPAHGFITAKNVTLTPAQITAPTTVLFNFTGVDAGGQAWSRDLSVAFVAPQVKQTILGSINAASGQKSYAPGMLLSIFGAELGDSPQSATAIPLPSILGGFEAFIDGNPAPLYYVSPGQVNVQIPYETFSGRVPLLVGNPYDTANPATLNIVATAPGIFASNGALVPFPTVARGTISTLFITGEGKVSPSLPTGATPDPTTNVRNLPKPLATPQTVTIGGSPAAIDFIGIPYGVVGVTQINFHVPADAPLGVQQVVVTIGSASSLPVNVTVTP